MDGLGSLTYRELNAKANQLAHYLRFLGVGPNKVRKRRGEKRHVDSVCCVVCTGAVCTNTNANVPFFLSFLSFLPFLPFLFFLPPSQGGPCVPTAVPGPPRGAVGDPQSGRRVPTSGPKVSPRAHPLHARGRQGESGYHVPGLAR